LTIRLEEEAKEKPNFSTASTHVSGRSHR